MESADSQILRDGQRGGHGQSHVSPNSDGIDSPPAFTETKLAMRVPVGDDGGELIVFGAPHPSSGNFRTYCALDARALTAILEGHAPVADVLDNLADTAFRVAETGKVE